MNHLRDIQRINLLFSQELQNLPDAWVYPSIMRLICCVRPTITPTDGTLSQNFPATPLLPEPYSPTCSECRSREVAKDEIMANTIGNVQRFTCETCGYRFVIDEGLLKVRSDGKGALADSCSELAVGSNQMEGSDQEGIKRSKRLSHYTCHD